MYQLNIATDRKISDAILKGEPMKELVCRAVLRKFSIAKVKRPNEIVLWERQ